MTPADWLRHEVAHELGMTLGQLKSSMTHREFLRWVIYFQDKWNKPSRTDHQLAQNTWVLWSILSVLTGTKLTKEIKDFLIKFDFKKRQYESTPVDELTPEEINNRVEARKKEQKEVSKWNRAALSAILGMEIPLEGKINIDLTKGIPKPTQSDVENRAAKKSKGPRRGR